MINYVRERIVRGNALQVMPQGRETEMRDKMIPVNVILAVRIGGFSGFEE